MARGEKPLLVSCSVLRKEIEKLIRTGELCADVIFVSKYFHVDYAQVEKALRPIIEKALLNHPENVVLVYGDLCLGMDNEMKKLAEEYGIAKIDALNCVDCQLGGRGKILKADPEHDLMFMSVGMTDFFDHAKEAMRKEGMEESSLKQLFSGIKGIVLMDALNDYAQLQAEVERLDTGLKIIRVMNVGCGNVRDVIQEAIERNKNAKLKKQTPNSFT